MSNSNINIDNSISVSVSEAPSPCASFAITDLDGDSDVKEPGGEPGELSSETQSHITVEGPESTSDPDIFDSGPPSSTSEPSDQLSSQSTSTGIL
jgi:hypothetical protein